MLVAGHDALALAEIAEAIHYQRHTTGEAPLWHVDAQTALPSELTRALGGLLRDENSGTLVVESIDHLPAEQQLELLTAMAADAWQAQIVATQVEASDADAAGMSDELAAAVSTIGIEIPLLADRPEDIPPLVAWHLDRLNHDAADSAMKVADDALDVMVLYPWPGETTELGEVVASAYRRARGAAVTARDLPKILHHAVDHAAMAIDRPEPIDLDDYLSRVETALVERALELASGNKAEAARLLGVSRPRLYRKLEQMGVVEPTPAKSKPQAVPGPSTEQKPTPPAEDDMAEDDIEFLPVDGGE